MPLMEITEESIKEIPQYSPKAPREEIYWDTALKGFGVRVSGRGIRTYVVRHYQNNRQSIKSIAHVHKMSLSQAKIIAKEIVNQLIKSAEEGITFSDYAFNYMRLYAKEHKKSWKLDQQRIDNYLNPKFGNRLLTEIKRRDILELLSSLKHKPIAANRLREMIVRMFELAKQWEYLPETWSNPAQLIKDYKENQRTRWCTAEEVQRICHSLRSEQDENVRIFFKLLILTSLRKANLLNATWSNVDLIHGQMFIPETKNGKPFTLKLSKESIALFRQLPRTSKYCFAGKSAGKPRNTVDKAWRRIRKRAMLEDVHIHDLRKTGPSWMVQAGYSLHTISKVLHHSSARSTEVYAHLADSNVVAAIEAFNAAMSVYMRETVENPESRTEIVNGGNRNDKKDAANVA